jgi:hypothetical protein
MQLMRVAMSLYISNWAYVHNEGGRVYVDVSMLVRVKVSLWVILLNLAFRT